MKRKKPSKESIEEIILECYSYSDICRKFNMHIKGRNITFFRELIKEYCINISHFDEKHSQRKYNIIYVDCPICGLKFKIKEGHKKSNITCSYSCANKYFRSGINNPRFKYGYHTRYRILAISFYGNSCVICGFDKVIQVHHINEDRKDNRLENIIKK